MRRRVTIHDVARAAGVSKVTVSYVLNGRASEMGIREDTAKRVFEASVSLGYRPSAVARMLSGQRSDTLAILFRSGQWFLRSRGFNGHVLDGVSEACFSEGFDLLLHTRPTKDAEEEAAHLMDGRIDGLLVLRDPDDRTYEILKSRGFPMVQFFCHNDDPEALSVDCDNRLGGRLAAQHLLELGHRRIAMAMGSPKAVNPSERLIGFTEALQAAGISIKPDWLIPHGPPEECGPKVLDLIRQIEPITALFAWCDPVAVAVLDHLQANGVKVPQDFSIVGFDSLEIAALANPPLTSIHQPVRIMAAEATHLLVSVVMDRPPEQRQVTFTPRLDIRSSTAAPNA